MIFFFETGFQCVNSPGCPETLCTPSLSPTQRDSPASVSARIKGVLSFLFVFETVSLYSPGCSRTHYGGDQTDLEFTEIHLSPPPKC